jgi:hypothetical protein
MNGFFKFTAVASIALIWCGATLAQNSTGSLAGVVRDPSGAVIGGA